MKNKIMNVSLLALFTFALISCGDDPFGEEENNPKMITVQFETAAREIAENAGEETLLLNLNRPAFSDVILTLKASASFDGVLNALPKVENGLISVPIQKGQTTAVIKLTPIDNQEQTGNRTLNISLHNLPFQFVEGVNKAVNIIVKDDETTSPVTESTVNFISQEITLEETYETGVEYQIHFSEAVALESSVRISLSADNGIYGLHYITEPEAEEGILTLPVSTGTRVIGFRVKPVANSQITGELKIQMTITETTGSLRKGNNLQQTLTIKDDELAGKPRGYVVTAGNTVVKKFYEYNAAGQIARVNWENYTPYQSQGTETYHYDVNGRLIKVSKHPGKDIVYHWSNEKIIRYDEAVNGVIRGYAEFEYDALGNVGLATAYHLQANGSFAKGLYTLYLYFLDGNLYKSITYQDTENPEEPYLVSTKTYENYIDVPNAFPMSEILPTVKTQTKLATTYRVEEGELDQIYHMVYEYRPDGLPEKRIATAPGDMQTATYHYY